MKEEKSMFNGVEIIDYFGFGELIRSWAKGLVPIPGTVGDLRAGDYPKFVKIDKSHLDSEPLDIIRLQPNPRISIVIPDATDIVDPPPGIIYPMPEFYARLVNFSVQPPVVKDPTSEFQSARLADYAFGKCL
jgi:hypothetical protein